METVFDRLVSSTEAERKSFLTIPAVARGLQGDIPLGAYVAFLTQAYHHVKHTVPLLMACGARLPERMEWLREAVGKYIQEETGHQEWILDDIAACGVNRDTARTMDPSPETELMTAYAYDTIARGNPVGFFGMVFVLEGTSTRLALAAADAIARGLGLPPDAFRYLRSHGALDVGHMDFYRSLVNRLNDEADQKALIHGAKMFYKLYGDIFRRISADHFSGTKKEEENHENVSITC